MFYVYTIQDHIIVKAGFLGQDLAAVLRHLILQKYIGKVLPKEGLCISLVYFHAGQTLVQPGEGDLAVSVSTAKHIGR